MKKLNKLKINQISKNEIEKREMNHLLGGNCCGCGCNYANNGGSSISGNYDANRQSNTPGSYGGTYYCGCLPGQYGVGDVN